MDLSNKKTKKNSLKKKQSKNLITKKNNKVKTKSHTNQADILQQIKILTKTTSEIKTLSPQFTKKIKNIESNIKKLKKQTLLFFKYTTNLETEFLNISKENLFKDKALLALENLQEFSRMSAITKDKELKAREAVLELSALELKEMDKKILSYELVTDMADHEKKERDRILRLVAYQKNEIKTAKEFAESIIHNAPIAIYTTDKEGIITTENPAMQILLNDWDNKAMGKKVFDLNSYKNTGILKHFEEALYTGKSHYVENLQLRSDVTGKSLIVNHNIVPLYKNNHEINGILVMYYDNSEKFYAEQQLKDAKDFAESIIHHAPIAIYTTDIKGNVLTENPAMKNILEDFEGKVVGTNIFKLESYKNFGLDLLCKEVLNKGQTLIVENYFFKSSITEKEIVVNQIFAPIYKQDKIAGLICMYDDITEKYNADEKLKDAKDFAESIIKNAPIAIYTTDINGTINTENNAMKEILGDYEGKAVGYNVFELKSYKSCGLDKVCKEVLLKGVNYYSDFVDYQSDITGKNIIANHNLSPIVQNRKINGLIGMFSDISTIYKTQQELKEERDLAENIIQNAPIAVYTTDKYGILKTENPAMQRLLDDWDKKAIGVNVLKLESYTSTGMVKHFEEALHEGKSHYIENLKYISSVTGKWVIVNHNIVPLFKNNEINGVLVMYYDHSEKYYAEEALKEAKDFAENIIMNAPIAIFTTDTHGKITSENPAMKKILGDYEGKAVGLNIMELDSYKKNGLDKICKDILLTGETQFMENLKFTSSITGKDIIVNQIYSPFYRNEKIAGLLCMYYDNTEKYRAEEALKNAILQITEDLSMAKKIQTKFLGGDYSQFKDLNFKVYFEPMIEVGGDLYDIYKVSDKYYRILLADAIGHGVQAALLTMIIKNEYDRIKILPLSPSKILSIFNNQFTNSYFNLNVFFTCCVIDIDLQNNKILTASAGHPDQFILANNKINISEGGGSIIGFRTDVEFKLKEYPFRQGDRLFLFTDGLFEEFNEKEEELDIENFQKLVFSHREKDIANLLEHTLSDVKKWLGNNKPNDDMTAIALEYK